MRDGEVLRAFEGGEHKEEGHDGGDDRGGATKQQHRRAEVVQKFKAASEECRNAFGDDEQEECG